MRTRHLRHRVAVIVAAVIVLSACASVPLKQKATLGLQAAHTAVGTAQDTERALYAAKTAGLTPEKHGQIAKLFEVYFGAEEKVAVALLAWRAGDPTPADLPTAMRALRDALNLAGQLTAGADRQSLVGAISKGIMEVQNVLNALGGGQ